MKFLTDRLTVVNCGSFHSQQVKAGAYACPAEGGAGSFKNHEYLALCWNKAARLVGRLHGVVDVNLQANSADVWWNNERTNGLSDEDLKEQARERLKIMFPDAKTTQRVFVLGELFPTQFHKHTAGGMYQRKLYFNVECLQPNSAEDLAQKLNGKQWNSYCKN